MSSAIDSILQSLPIEEIAGKVGLSPDDARPAIAEAVGSVLAGIDANAADPAGEASLANALGQHEDALPDDGISLDDIDTTDGGKIVKNVFGDKAGDVAAAIGSSKSVASADQIQKLLPLVAPVVMAFLAKQVLGGKGGSGGGGGALGNILGSVLGGSEGGLGGLLGGLLGGGRR